MRKEGHSDRRSQACWADCVRAVRRCLTFESLSVREATWRIYIRHANETLHMQLLPPDCAKAIVYGYGLHNTYTDTPTHTCITPPPNTRDSQRERERERSLYTLFMDPQVEYSSWIFAVLMCLFTKYSGSVIRDEVCIRIQMIHTPADIFTALFHGLVGSYIAPDQEYSVCILAAGGITDLPPFSASISPYSSGTSHLTRKIAWPEIAALIISHPTPCQQAQQIC